MNRTQILEQITELDRQIKDLTAKNRVPSLNAKHRAFPISAWTTALVFAAIGVFGDQFVPALAPYMMWSLLLGALFGVFALYRTFMWIMKGNQKNDKKYAEAMVQVAELQKQRAALQQALDKAG